MSWKEYIFLVKSDLYRYLGISTWRVFLFCLFLMPGFKYSFWMRTCAYFKGNKLLHTGFFHIARIILCHYEYKLGISISYKNSIGSGFYIGHFGGIVIGPDVVIGKNCNISQEVTIGISLRGERQGTPIIGDNVYIGPGAKIFGGIKIGKNVAIGANSVVTKDVPPNAVIVGVPGMIVSFDGSYGYILHTNYLA